MAAPVTPIASDSHRLPETPVSPSEERLNGKKSVAEEQWASDSATAAGPQDRQHQQPQQHSPTSSPISASSSDRPSTAAGASAAATNMTSFSIPRRPAPQPAMDIRPPSPSFRLQDAPVSPVSIRPARKDLPEPEAASIISQTPRGGSSRSSSMLGGAERDRSQYHIRRVSEQQTHTPDSTSGRTWDSPGSLPVRSRPSSAQGQFQDYSAIVSGHHRSRSSGVHSPPIDEDDEENLELQQQQEQEGFRYHAFDDAAPKKRPANRVSASATSSASSTDRRASPVQAGLQSSQLGVPRTTLSRPTSSFTLNGDYRGRTLSPLSNNGSDPGSPHAFARDLSANRRSPSVRPTSYIDLLNNIPYDQQIAPGPPRNNASLQHQVGRGASLLDTKKTLEMYRANVKKTVDPAIQYEFAIFMINAATDAPTQHGGEIDPLELQTEAKHILQRLADRGYPFAQYYLADGYFSGLFSKGKPDYDRAFPLFASASRHGHAEAGYRAALCYEFGWGTARSYQKAVQFYKTSASKNHPGAATRLGLASIRGDMGLIGKGSSGAYYRDGVKWLKRAQESADHQYNAGPYELGLMHLHGDDRDIFRDEAYAAKLFTQSAELGHPEANFLMGRAYELGELGCPKDAALSVHFYNGAATRGHVEGMMALCAWYMVGAEPVLEKNEAEAYEWAKQAAQAGHVKAQYALGYFTEMGIGCRRDPLEANVWYVRAADAGYENARQRLEIIRTAAAGGGGPGPAEERNGGGRSASNPVQMAKAEAKSKDLQHANGSSGGGGKKKFMGIF